MITDTLTHAKLITQQLILQDSIHHLNNKLHQQQITGLDVMTSVNAFYQSAWNNLLWFVGIILGIGGIVLPILVQIWQKRTLKLSEAALRDEINATVQHAKSELQDIIKSSITSAKEEMEKAINNSITIAKADIDNLITSTKSEMLESAKLQIDEKIANFDKEVKRVNNALLGRTLQLQARGLEGQPYRALRSYLLAIKFYSKSIDYKVGSKLLEFITRENSPIRKMNKTELDKDFESAGLTFTKVVENIGASNEKADFKAGIAKIIDIYNNLPK